MDDTPDPDPKPAADDQPRQGPIPLAERRRYLRQTEDSKKPSQVYNDWASI